MERALARVEAGEPDPPCRSCGGILKSATISFGQQLVQRDLMRAEAAAQSCDLMLTVGSTLSSTRSPRSCRSPSERGARVVILNADDTGFDDHRRRGRAGADRRRPAPHRRLRRVAPSTTSDSAVGCVDSAASNGAIGTSLRDRPRPRND